MRKELKSLYVKSATKVSIKIELQTIKGYKALIYAI